MKLQLVGTMVAMALASPLSMADNVISSSADATVHATIVNPIAVFPPEMDNNEGLANISGNLGVLEKDTEYPNLKIVFTVQSTAAYPTQMQATTPDCAEMGENGLVTITNEEAFAVTSETDEFTQDVGYSYKTPNAVMLDGTDCTINLKAWYE